MALDKIVDSSQLDADLTTVANAIRTKGGTSAQLSFPIGMASAIAAISGGIEITDGIIVTARNADGWATEAELYPSSDGTIGRNALGNYLNRNDGSWSYGLEKLTINGVVTQIKGYAFNNARNLRTILPSGAFNAVTTIGGFVFYYTQLSSLFLPELTDMSGNASFRNMPSLKEFYAHKLTNLSKSALYMFQNCPMLETVVIGSIGYGNIGLNNRVFSDLVHSGVTITMYCTGVRADALLADIRNGATNATIIIKASEDTTYSGTAYAAGDTMITSNP